MGNKLKQYMKTDIEKITDAQAVKELRAKMRVYRQCNRGKPVDCDKCIGCAYKGLNNAGQLQRI